MRMVRPCCCARHGCTSLRAQQLRATDSVSARHGTCTCTRKCPQLRALVLATGSTSGVTSDAHEGRARATCNCVAPNNTPPKVVHVAVASRPAVPSGPGIVYVLLASTLLAASVHCAGVGAKVGAPTRYPRQLQGPHRRVRVLTDGTDDTACVCVCVCVCLEQIRRREQRGPCVVCALRSASHLLLTTPIPCHKYAHTHHHTAYCRCHRQVRRCWVLGTAWRTAADPLAC